LKQQDQLAVEMAYLEKGIIPRSPVFKDGDYLKAGLDSLDVDEATTVKRKFRKCLRRAIAWRERHIYHTRMHVHRHRWSRSYRRHLAQNDISYFRLTIGLGSCEQLTNKQRGARRQLVDSYIRDCTLINMR